MEKLYFKGYLDPKKTKKVINYLKCLGYQTGLMNGVYHHQPCGYYTDDDDILHAITKDNCIDVSEYREITLEEIQNVKIYNIYEEDGESVIKELMDRGASNPRGYIGNGTRGFYTIDKNGDILRVINMNDVDECIPTVNVKPTTVEILGSIYNLQEVKQLLKNINPINNEG